MNKAILIGHLGKDPEVSYTQAGQAVCKFSLATTDRWTDKSGEKKSVTDWHRVVVWGKLGEIAAKYLSKGSKTLVEGKIKTRQYQDKSGAEKYVTEIVASDIEFLDPRESGGRQDSGNSAPRQHNKPDDLPF